MKKRAIPNYAKNYPRRVKMEAPKRTKEEIQKDYNETALQAGHASYTVRAWEANLAQLQEKMLKLNQELAAIPAVPVETAAAETPAV